MFSFERMLKIWEKYGHMYWNGLGYTLLFASRKENALGTNNRIYALRKLLDNIHALCGFKRG